MIAICIEYQGVSRPMQNCSSILQFIGPPPNMLRDPQTSRCVGPAIRTRYDAYMARNEQEQSEQGYELLTVQCRMARAVLSH
jgi:hypothetical protein